MNIEEIMQKAFNLGQQYWQQADSDSNSQWKKSELTLEKFQELSLSVFTDMHQVRLQLDDLTLKNSRLLEALEVMTSLVRIKYGNLDADVYAEIKKSEALIKAAKGE